MRQVLTHSECSHVLNIQTGLADDTLTDADKTYLFVLSPVRVDVAANQACCECRYLSVHYQTSASKEELLASREPGI